MRCRLLGAPFRNHRPCPPRRAIARRRRRSMANCTTEYPGRDDSDIGEGLAACGCVDNAPGNGLPPYGSLAPLVVLDQGLGDATLAACGNGTAEAVAPECQAVGANAAPFCAALANNTLYGGADLVSLFAVHSGRVGGGRVPLRRRRTQPGSPPLRCPQESPDGAINTTCTPASGSFGLWANCMSAACVRETGERAHAAARALRQRCTARATPCATRRPSPPCAARPPPPPPPRCAAFDGSPVTCFCPIVNTSEPYQVGAPFTTPTDTLCTSHLPGYLLSGKPLTSS